MQGSSVRAANSSQDTQQTGNVTGDHTVRSWSDTDWDTNFGLLEYSNDSSSDLLLC